MKKLFIIVLFAAMIVVPGLSLGQTWYNTNQATLLWGAVVTLDEDIPLPAGETMYYHAYLKKGSADSVPIKVSSDPFEALEYTFTFEEEGKYFMGVSAVRVLEGEEYESPVAWSHNEIDCRNNEAFGILYIVTPAKPFDLRRK